MSQDLPATAVARNWFFFKKGLLGITPIAVFGVLLVIIFLRTNLLPVSAFFHETTLTFNMVLYISIAVWIAVMAIANGHRLQRKQDQRAELAQPGQLVKE